MTDEQWRKVWKLCQPGSSVSQEQLDALLHDPSTDPEMRDAVLAFLEPGSESSGPDRVGRKIGKYVFTGRLGQGGAGEVYAARDQELGRLVAVKFLLPAGEGKSQPFDRFVREARAASALNHPNIVTIFEVLHAATGHAIVMEFVEGTPLRLLCGTPLPVDRVMDLGSQIAQALAATHARGVVHCDIKPENVMVRKDGLVKVLDFGLARDLGDISTGTMPAGFTLRYLSPERLQGEAPSSAGDIFALGIVLYELAAGIHPFGKESLFATLQSLDAATPPPPSTSNAFVPPELDGLILKMLAKEPATRPSAEEVAQSLQSRTANRKVRVETTQPPVPLPTRAAAHPPSNRRWLADAIACLALVTAATAFAWFSRRVPSLAPVRFSFSPPFQTSAVNVAVSPDGTRIAFSDIGGSSGLWVRSTNSFQSERLPGTETAISPAWSPDGRSIAFISFVDGLRKIDVDGRPSPPQTLTRQAVNYTGCAWSSQGVILYNPQATGSGLWGVPAAGGTPSAVTHLNTERQELTHRYPQFLPGGKRFLYWVWSTLDANTGVYVGSLDPGDKLPPGPLVRTWREARYSDSGHLLYLDGYTWLARRFDPETLRFTGEATPLPENIAQHRESTGRAIFSVAGANALVFQEAMPVPPPSLTIRDRTGKPVRSLIAPPGAQYPSLNRQGTAVVLHGEDDNTLEAVWSIDLARGVAARPWISQASNQRPIWSHDGRRIAFYSNQAGAYDIYIRNADGSGQEELLVKSPHAKVPYGFSPDGRFLFYSEDHPESKGDLWFLPLEGTRTPVPFVRTPANEFFAAVSPVPDQRGQYWVAYCSDETGVLQLYLRPLLPGGSSAQVGPAIPVSNHSAYLPRWRADGRELFYIEVGMPGTNNANRLVAVDVLPGNPPKIGLPHKLFDIPPGQGVFFDVFADGQRFVSFEPPAASPSATISVALNWAANLK